MGTALGLDLGANSIGWALVDDERNKILGMGSRIFLAGVENLGEGEKELSKNAGRTQHRGARRQLFRRRLRKRYLLRTLAQHRLCPLADEDLKHGEKEEIFLKPDLVNWFRLNPYSLRARAISEKITLQELGRIFYHMIQRRGFQSNSRSAAEDDKSVIFKGNAAEGKIGITETRENIAAHKTLGAYLNDLYPQENRPYQNGKERIRNRYTTRQMYINEFEAIWAFQQQYHSELTPALKTIIGGRKKEGFNKDGVLFHQRPLRSQKHLVGYCSLEPRKTRCLISAIPFEKFRVYQWVNTVECNGHKLNEEERQKLVKKLVNVKDKVAFKALRKELDKMDSAYHFNYKDDDKIVGAHTMGSLSHKKFFGKQWFAFTEKEQTDIWHALYFYEDRDKLEEYAKAKWGFDEESAHNIAKFNLKKGYAHLSRKAINNILPFLEQGFTYNVATVLGGIKNAFGSRWNSLSDEEKKLIIDNIEGIVSKGQKGGFIEGLKAFLKAEFTLSEEALKKLYHHSANINAQTTTDRLPIGAEADKEIQSIRNPVVITALFELRKLVNEILKTHGKPDKISIELARDLKISKSKRDEVRREQKRLEKENDRVKQELSRIGQHYTHDNMVKYKLWEECNNICPYTGRTINVTQLFHGNVQIEHIMPYSKSLNDSFMNKTLCFANENRAKGDRTPYEFYGRDQSPDHWDHIKQQALNCFKNKDHYPNAYAKFKHFVKEKYDDDFVSRQLNDTRYISKAAKSYLAKIVAEKNIESVFGQATAPLRHKWGLNKLLGDTDTKSRDDHCHHAIDALVVACMQRSHLQALSRWNKNHYNGAGSKTFPRPWDGFWEDAKTSVAQLLVSYKKNNNLLTYRKVKTEKEGKIYVNKGISVRGQLHKESVYGLRKAPHAEEAYHIRKPITTLTTVKQVEKVVDPVIQKLIRERIAALGGPQGDKLPSGVFFRKDEQGVMHPQLFLPNKNGEPIPIKRVRIREVLGRAEQLKTTNQYVNPKNNHHVLIYKDSRGELKEEMITFWTAVERKRQGSPFFGCLPTAANG